MAVLRKFINNTLDRIGTKFQFDLDYFVKGGFWLTLPLIANYVLGILRSVVFARFLNQTTYGQFGFINSTIGLVTLLALPGVNTALVETVARGNQGALIDAAKIRFRWSILSTIVIAGIATYYWYLGNLLLVMAFLLAGAFLPLRTATAVVQGYYNGRKRFNFVSIMAIGTSVAETLFIVLAVWLQGGLLWLILASSIAQLMWYAVFFLRALPETRHQPRDANMGKYGRSLSGAQAINSAIGYLDNVILGFSASFAEVAIYRIASVLPAQIKNLSKRLPPLVMPKAVQKSNERFYNKRQHNRLLLLTTINLAIVLTSIAILPALMNLLYGDRYTESILYAQLLMATLLLSLPGSVLNGVLDARKQTRIIYQASLLNGVLGLSTLFFFVPWLGIRGIILSRMITRLSTVTFRWYKVSKI